MSVFDIDYKELARVLLPVRLRKAVTLRWLQCLMVPLMELHRDFAKSREARLYRVAHTSQVTFMEGVLNDRFDRFHRRIYIDDGGTAEYVWVYLRPEEKPVWLGLRSEVGITYYGSPLWLYTPPEAEEGLYDFLIMVPVGLAYDFTILRALTDRYRLPGMSRYAVRPYM
jgi:hypothetical protein